MIPSFYSNLPIDSPQSPFESDISFLCQIDELTDLVDPIRFALLKHVPARTQYHFPISPSGIICRPITRLGSYQRAKTYRRPVELEPLVVACIVRWGRDVECNDMCAPREIRSLHRVVLGCAVDLERGGPY